MIPHRPTSPRIVTDADIADIYEALGDPVRAGYFRADDGPDPDALTADELAQAITDVIDSVPGKGRGTHDERCWQKHAPCLVEKIRELLP